MENKISKNKSVLVVFSQGGHISHELQYLTENFCGIVVKDFREVPQMSNDKRVYICGDLTEFDSNGTFVYVIKELSQNYENLNPDNVQLITLGQVPVVVHEAGVYFRHFFQILCSLGVGY